MTKLSSKIIFLSAALVASTAGAHASTSNNLSVPDETLSDKKSQRCLRFSQNISRLEEKLNTTLKQLPLGSSKSILETSDTSAPASKMKNSFRKLNEALLRNEKIQYEFLCGEDKSVPLPNDPRQG